ncbi:DUF3742 family protein [Burkholderia pseudomallei]|uniref:DUF3742 family protein n=1 Tax=Burkholderia pseudomallei TaxID=28450 RepID=UPI001A9FD55B|nr:DUF3742 family protein [Burkholderia pseudomallei]QTB44272.1 DUF3742 family protein [Burkholderia pseudomallei]QTB67360.1 DUF3742 family protein [Burkholderia pseudomallei]
MKTTAHTTVAERIGRGLGRAWLAIRRQERRAVQWMVGKGLTAGTARMLLWGAKLILFGALLYAALWLAVVLILIVTAAFLASHVDVGQLQDQPFTGESDHKQNLFYDPINYNDDPDPRFDDK